MGYARGLRAWGECQRCGFRVLYVNLLVDGDTPGLLVCGSCWDPKHPQDLPPPIGADEQALYRPSPEVSAPANEGDAVTSFTTYLVDPIEE